MLKRTETHLDEAYDLSGTDSDRPNQDNDARVPFSKVLTSIAALWLCYYLFISLRSLLIDNADIALMMALRLLVVAAGVVVTCMAWLVLRTFDKRALTAKIVAAVLIMLPAALVLAMVNQAVFAPIDKQIMASNPHPEDVGIRHDTAGNILVEVPDPPGLTPDQISKLQDKLSNESIWRQTTDIAISRYFLLLAWAALYLALLNGEQARVAERREGEYRRAAKASELRLLRYQINPHFLFNTLNSLSSLVLTGKGEAAEKMIQMLSAFYRRGLSDDPTSDHPLAEEITLQRLYLDIEAVRFPERLRLAVEVPAELEGYPVPGMILQPLVENAVKYGVARSRRPVTITVSAHVEYGRLVLRVSDNGQASAPAEHGFGIGLANVRDRLQARFGAAASLTAGAIPGGFSTELRLPLPA